MRTLSEALRRYALDESFFNCIDTEDKAYWLGFLTADGLIGDDFVRIDLQLRDIDHLHKFTASLLQMLRLDLLVMFLELDILVERYLVLWHECCIETQQFTGNEGAVVQAQPRLQRKVLHLFETISAKLEI
jgi:hypothetical protein